MGLTVSVFHFLDDGCVKRVPMTKWNPIGRGDKPYIGYENQKIKMAFAYIERIDRKPVYCPRIEGLVYRTDERGYVNFYERLKDFNSPLADLPIFDDGYDLQMRKTCSMFRRKCYSNRHLWQLSPSDIQKIVDAVF